MINNAKAKPRAAVEERKARKDRHPKAGVGKASRRYVHSTGRSEKTASNVSPAAIS